MTMNKQPGPAETLQERERLLSQLCADDRELIERLMVLHPRLSARRAIADLTAFGGL